MVTTKTAKNPQCIIIQDKKRKWKEDKSDSGETEEHSKAIHTCELEGQ